MKKTINYSLRVLFYCIGLLFLAFGVAFSLNSGLGVSPINSLPYVISLIIGIDMGTCVIAVFAFYILLQIIIKGKEFKWINLTQIIFSTIFGYFVNFAKLVVGDFTLPGYFGKLALIVISIIFVAIGVAIYMDVHLVNMPMEGLTLAISEKLPKYKFHQVKITIDCLAVGIAIALSFVFLGGLMGIREGTILSAFFVGKTLPYVKKYTEPIISKICGK